MIAGEPGGSDSIRSLIKSGSRITDQLKQYFSQVLGQFDDVDSQLVAAFLDSWPTLPELQADAPSEILELLHAHNSRSRARNEQRLQEVATARPLTTDTALVQPAVLLVEVLLNAVQVLRDGIAKMDAAIARLCTEHSDYAIFDSFPGAGDVLAPRLLAAFGSKRERYSDAGELQTYSGIAPVISRSGKSQSIHFRQACPKFLRQTFHEHAERSIQFSSWARLFYDPQRAKGKEHHAAVRSLAFKQIRILYRCWVDRVPYSEQRHVAALAARANAAVTKEVAAPATPAQPAATKQNQATVECVWEKVAGFLKFSAATS